MSIKTTWAAVCANIARERSDYAGWHLKLGNTIQRKLPLENLAFYIQVFGIYMCECAWYVLLTDIPWGPLCAQHCARL